MPDHEGSTNGAQREQLIWRRITVDGRPVAYGEGGTGLPVVFLHGWGLGHRAYRTVLREVAECGCRVVAPSLPGFGGTADLPAGRRTVEGYATWVADFLDRVGVNEPAVVVGHSFGGGVATRFAYDAPTRTRYLVLINSVGGTTWQTTGGGALRQVTQPLWRYNLEFARELFCTAAGPRIVRAMREDVLHNVLRNPLALAEIGMLARHADLTTELEALRRGDVPVMVLGSDRDGVIPSASFETLCATIGTEGQVIEGGHSWLLANPTALRRVFTNVVKVEASDDEPTDTRATGAELRRLLRRTTMPRTTAAQLVDRAPALWMMSERPAVLAGDLVLCHPPLDDGEVRAVARQLDQPNAFRLTVVAADRPGLLADTAAALAAERISVQSASAATWDGVALHAMNVVAPRTSAVAWDTLGERLRSMGDQPRPAAHYLPIGRATVTVGGEGTGHTLVEVRAPDGIGLLEAIAGWFADHGVSIEAAKVSTRHGMANDVFLVEGAFQPALLEAHLSWVPGTALRPRLPGAELMGRLVSLVR